MSAPLLERGRPGLGRAATGADYGAAEGVAQSQAGQAVQVTSEVAARVTDAEQRIRVQRIASSAQSRLRDGVSEILANPDWRTYEERFDALRQEIDEGLEDDETLLPGYREALRPRIQDHTDTLRLEVVQAGRKLQLADAGAQAHETLKEYSNLFARAKTPDERQQHLESSARLIAAAKASGIWGADEAMKAARAFEASSAGAALVEGINTDPTGTLAALEAQAGAFAWLDEEDRQKAIAQTKARIESLARQERGRVNTALRMESVERARLRFDQQQADRAEKQRGDSAVVAGWQAAGSKEGLTADTLAALTPDLDAHPAAFGQFTKIVAAGGRLALGPPDPAEYAKAVILMETDPAAFAELPIGEGGLDPAMLGSKFFELARAQGAIRGGEAPPLAGNLLLANDRWSRVDEFAKDVRGSFLDVSDEEALALRGEFFLKVDEAQAAYVAGEGKGKPAIGPAFEKLLDGVVIDFAAGRARGSDVEGIRRQVTGRLGAAPPLPTPTPRDTAGRALEGISAGNLETVRETIRASGLKNTPAEIRRVYDAAVAAGMLEP